MPDGNPLPILARALRLPHGASFRRLTVLLTLAVLLLTTERSPAAVTVLPEATPTPAPKEQKPSKHKLRSDKSTAESAQNTDPKLMAGTWRGRLSGQDKARGVTRPTASFEEFTISDDLRTITERSSYDGRDFSQPCVYRNGEPIKRATDVVTTAVRMEGNALIAEKMEKDSSPATSQTQFIFRLQSRSTMHVSNTASMTRSGITASDDLQGVLHRQ